MRNYLKQYYIHAGTNHTYRSMKGTTELEYYSNTAGRWLSSSRMSDIPLHTSILIPIVHPLIMWTTLTVAISLLVIGFGATL